MNWEQTIMDAIISAISALPLEQQSAWRDLHEVSDDAPFSLDWSTLPRWTPEHRDAVAAALRDWVLLRSDSREALEAITSSCRRVGVWLACVAARTVLRFVRFDEDRPRAAIETAERWVRTQATDSECVAACNASYAAAADAFRIAESYTHADAANAAANAAFAVSSSVASASAAAAATAAASSHTSASNVSYDDRWHAAHKRYLRDLCQTIAHAVRDALDAASEGYERNALDLAALSAHEFNKGHGR